MEDADWMAHWREVYDGLVLIGPPELRHRMTPIDEHLDRLEGRLGCRLPASYRAFVKVFGPGDLARAFTVFAPGYRSMTRVDFLANNKWQESEAGWRAEPDRIRRLIAFAEYSGELQPFCWDPKALRDSTGPEYQIVYVPRDRRTPLLPVADSFGSFVADYCLGGGFRRLLGYMEEMTDVDDDTGEPRSIRSFWPTGGEIPGSKF